MDYIRKPDEILSHRVSKGRTFFLSVKEDFVMVDKNLKKLQAKKRRVTNGFNTGTRDMKLKTAYRRNKRWSADVNLPAILLP